MEEKIEEKVDSEEEEEEEEEDDDDEEESESESEESSSEESESSDDDLTPSERAREKLEVDNVTLSERVEKHYK